jgi:hypothetical protein
MSAEIVSPQKQKVSTLNLNFFLTITTLKETVTQGFDGLDINWMELENLSQFQHSSELFQLTDEFEISILDSSADSTDSEFYSCTVPFILRTKILVCSHSPFRELL